MPEDKPIEVRRQTAAKLELTDRYWKAWCTILARARAATLPFCNRHLWLIDTMAGAGLHESIDDPDGEVPGTPLQAVLAARMTQLHYPDISIHVRAIDVDNALVAQLEGHLAPYRGAPPTSVDVTTHSMDWVAAVPDILREIAGANHPHPRGRGAHDHRSLWLIDPFGVGPIDRTLIEHLPRGSEVMLNFDENAARWHAAKALGGDDPIGALLNRLYGDDRWRAAVGQPTGAFAESFAASFAGQYRHANHYPLWSSGSQDRFFIHLANADRAPEAFGRAHAAALKAGTLWAGNSLTKPQRDIAAESLHARFKGETLTVKEMYELGVPYSTVQIRTICTAAVEELYGEWMGQDEFLWFESRRPAPGLWG